MADDGGGFLGGFSRGIDPYLRMLFQQQLSERNQASRQDRQFEHDIEKQRQKHIYEQGLADENFRKTPEWIDMIQGRRSQPQQQQPTQDQPPANVQALMPEQLAGPLPAEAPIRETDVTGQPSMASAAPQQPSPQQPTPRQLRRVEPAQPFQPTFNRSAKGETSVSMAPTPLAERRNNATLDFVGLLDQLPGVDLTIAQREAETRHGATVDQDVVKAVSKRRFEDTFAMNLQVLQQSQPDMLPGDAITKAAIATGKSIGFEHMDTPTKEAILKSNWQTMLKDADPRLSLEMFLSYPETFRTGIVKADEIKAARDMMTVRETNDKAREAALIERAKLGAAQNPATSQVPQLPMPGAPGAPSASGEKAALNRTGVLEQRVQQLQKEIVERGGGQPQQQAQAPGAMTFETKQAYDTSAGRRQAEQDVAVPPSEAERKTILETGSLIRGQRAMLNAFNPDIIGPATGTVKMWAKSWGLSQNISESEAMTTMQTYFNNVIRIAAGLTQSISEETRAKLIAAMPNMTMEQLLGTLRPMLKDISENTKARLELEPKSSGNLVTKHLQDLVKMSDDNLDRVNKAIDFHQGKGQKPTPAQQKTLDRLMNKSQPASSEY